MCTPNNIISQRTRQKHAEVQRGRDAPVITGPNSPHKWTDLVKKISIKTYCNSTAPMRDIMNIYSPLHPRQQNVYSVVSQTTFPMTDQKEP